MRKIKSFIWFYITQIMAASIIIYGIDKLFAAVGNNTYVGINAFTMLFCGLAGVPGIIVLFSLALILKTA